MVVRAGERRWRRRGSGIDIWEKTLRRRTTDGREGNVNGMTDGAVAVRPPAAETERASAERRSKMSESAAGKDPLPRSAEPYPNRHHPSSVLTNLPNASIYDVVALLADLSH